MPRRRPAEARRQLAADRRRREREPRDIRHEAGHDQEDGSKAFEHTVEKRAFRRVSARKSGAEAPGGIGADAPQHDKAEHAGRQRQEDGTSETKDGPRTGEATASAMRENFAALAMLAQPGRAPQIVRSGETSLEGLTRELLRPMLAKWLDANLPAMVEDMVKAVE